MKYSPTTQGFYDPEVNKTIPADAVEITRDHHAFLLAGQSSGKVIAVVSGSVVLQDPPPKTQAELDAEATAAAKAELVAIDLASIRSIREYLASRPDAPQHLKDRETAAIAARARIK